MSTTQHNEKPQKYPKTPEKKAGTPTSGFMTSPLVPLTVTSHPVAMSVMRNGTICTTIVGKKRGEKTLTSGHAQNILPLLTSLPVT